MHKSEAEKMLAGELYYSFGPELTRSRANARSLTRQFNQVNRDNPEEEAKAKDILLHLLGSFDAAEPPCIEPPFFVDYGSNIFIGKDVFINFNCTFLDCNIIRVGDRCLFGPNVQLYTAGHPLDGHVRKGTKGPEFAKPITVGNDCWFGGGAIVLGNVTIGDGVVVAAGAVVTKDVEPYVVVAGNPARIIRRLDEPPPAAANDSAVAASAESQTNALEIIR